MERKRQRFVIHSLVCFMPLFILCQGIFRADVWKVFSSHEQTRIQTVRTESTSSCVSVSSSVGVYSFIMETDLLKCK